MKWKREKEPQRRRKLEGVGVILSADRIPLKRKVKRTTLATTMRTSTRNSKSFYATEREMRPLSSMSLSYFTTRCLHSCTVFTFIYIRKGYSKLLLATYSDHKSCLSMWEKKIYFQSLQAIKFLWNPLLFSWRKLHWLRHNMYYSVHPSTEITMV